MCHGTLHTVVNALRHVLPGIAISMSWLIYNVTGDRKPDDWGGGGVICVSHGFRMVCIYLSCYFLPCVCLAASDTAAALGGCASVPKCLHIVTDS